MYFATVLRCRPVRRAIAETVIPCWCSSNITISSANLTTHHFPRPIGGEVASVRTPFRQAQLSQHSACRPRIAMSVFQSPDLARIHPAMTPTRALRSVLPSGGPDGCGHRHALEHRLRASFSLPFDACILVAHPQRTAKEAAGICDARGAESHGASASPHPAADRPRRVWPARGLDRRALSARLRRPHAECRRPVGAWLPTLTDRVPAHRSRDRHFGASRRSTLSRRRPNSRVRSFTPGL